MVRKKKEPFLSEEMRGWVPEEKEAKQILKWFKEGLLPWRSSGPTPKEEDAILSSVLFSSNMADFLSEVAGPRAGGVRGKYRNADVWVLRRPGEEGGVLAICERGDRGTGWYVCPRFAKSSTKVFGGRSLGPNESALAETVQSISERLALAALRGGESDEAKMIRDATSENVSAAMQNMSPVLERIRRLLLAEDEAKALASEAREIEERKNIRML